MRVLALGIRTTPFDERCWKSWASQRFICHLFVHLQKRCDECEALRAVFLANDFRTPGHQECVGTTLNCILALDNLLERLSVSSEIQLAQQLFQLLDGLTWPLNLLSAATWLKFTWLNSLELTSLDSTHLTWLESDLASYVCHWNSLRLSWVCWLTRMLLVELKLLNRLDLSGVPLAW